MKKTILVTSLLVAASAFAETKTTGTFNAYNKTKTKLTKSAELYAEAQATTTTPGFDFDVKVEGTGLNFGGKYYLFGMQPLAAPDTKSESLEKLAKMLGVNFYGQVLTKSRGSLWAKYDLPEMKGIKSYFKLSYVNEPEIEGLSHTMIGEANAGYEYKGYNFGLNSKTYVPVFDAKDNISSTHTLSVKKDKLSVFSDLEGSVAVSHYYAKINGTAFDRVEFDIAGSYKEVKDLTVKAATHIEYSAQGAKFNTMEKHINDGAHTEVSGKSVLDTYELSAEYKGVKDLTLTAKGEIKHLAKINDKTPNAHKVEYGLDLKAEYKGVQNLTLTGNALFYGQHKVNEGMDNNGFVGLIAAAKYDYKATDKFTVSPEGEIAYFAAKLDGTNDLHTLFLTPKVSAEYKISDALTLTGDISAKVRFDNASGSKFEYKNTIFKTGVNLKYTW